MKDMIIVNGADSRVEVVICMKGRSARYLKTEENKGR